MTTDTRFEWDVKDVVWHGELATLGGPGSGNFGHAGRPGEVGGSAPGDGASAADNKIISRPASHYTPSFAEGRDTKERFSDGKGNYTPERAELHQAIINKYMRGTTSVEHPKAIVLGGAPGVGKSTAVKAEKIGGENTVHINPDDIRNDIPDYAPDAEGRRPASTNFTHEEASDIGHKLVRQAAQEKRNLLLDGTGDSSIEKLGGKVAQMRARGATVEAVYVTTTVEESQRRADARSNDPTNPSYGRRVPPRDMQNMHKAVSTVFPEAIRQGLFDSAKLFDTTTHKSVLVASAKRRELTVHDPELWEAFLKKANR